MKTTAPPYIPYARQHIDHSDIAQVKASLTKDIITRGDNVEAFEREVASYCGAAYAVAFNSGTTALQAAYYAAKTNISDRIITTPNTFVSTVGPALFYSKAPPIFVDIDPVTRNMDITKLSNLISHSPSRGKNIIVPVHFAGIPVDMQQLEQQITSPDTVVIEDAAHALGSSYSKTGPRVGSCAWSHMTVFSFHPAKTITTGEGGMVTTKDPGIKKRLRRFRNNGIEYRHDVLPWLYDVHEITGNYNFTEFQAALGLSQMSKLDSFIKYRRRVVSWYRRELEKSSHITLSPSSYDAIAGYHILVASINFKACKTTRDRVMKALHKKGIGTQVHYIPVYCHPYFMKRFGEVSSNFPNMEKYYSQAITLPLYYGLEEKSVTRICKELRKLL